MSDTELKQRKWPEVYGGGGLGLLVGVLLGLSATEVVGGVITALMALLATYLGLKGQPASEDGSKTNSDVSANQAIRLGSFALVCVVGIFIALIVRTHNLAGRSIQDQVQQLKDAGYPDSTARTLVAFREYGIKPTSLEVTDHAAKLTDRANSLLFGLNTNNCGKLRPSSFRSVKDVAFAWQIEDDALRAVADSILRTVPETAQMNAFQKYWEAMCVKP